MRPSSDILRQPMEPPATLVKPKTSAPRGTRASQRSASRARIIEAGRSLAVEGRFMESSLAEIAAKAGISRAGFYLHFKSKDDLQEALRKDQMAGYVRQHATASPRRLASRGGVLAWFKEFVQLFRDTGELRALYYSGIPMEVLHRESHEIRRAALDTLGHRLPRLGLFRADGTADEDRRQELLLFLYQFEQVALTLAHHQVIEHTDLNGALERLADRFLELMQRGAD